MRRRWSAVCKDLDGQVVHRVERWTQAGARREWARLTLARDTSPGAAVLDDIMGPGRAALYTVSVEHWLHGAWRGGDWVPA